MWKGGAAAKTLAEAYPDLAPKFTFFYSAHPGAWNSENGFLAQTYRNGILIPIVNKNGQRILTSFRSAEQYYQYSKALIIAKHDCNKEPAESTDITAIGLPVRVLAAGKTADWKKLTHSFVLGTAAQEWEDTICTVLYTANFYKFLTKPALLAKLLATNDTYLVEACPRDCECDCGIGMPWDEALKGQGLWRRNLLGKVLMLLRVHLRQSPRAPDPTAEELAEAMAVEDTIVDGRDAR